MSDREKQEVLKEIEKIKYELSYHCNTYMPEMWESIENIETIVGIKPLLDMRKELGF